MDDTLDMTTAERRHLEAVLAAADELAVCLGVPTGRGSTRLSPCIDDLGQLLPDRHVEYGAEGVFEVGAVTDAAIDRLPLQLGVTFTQDSRTVATLEDYRQVRFSGVNDGVKVFVAIRLDSDGTLHLSISSGCGT